MKAETNRRKTNGSEFEKNRWVERERENVEFSEELMAFVIIGLSII